jgi:hypothetical protein
MNSLHSSIPAREGQRGQVLPVFIIFLTALLLTASLLLDASMALLMRRDYQNATDAAAMAAANAIQSGSPRGCSAIDGFPPGPPRAAVVNAAKASISKNLPNYDLENVVVTCPDGWDNIGVTVQLQGDSPGFFSRVVGIESFAVSTKATAINGYPPGSRYSVVQLDPYNPTWKNGTQGCPSILFSGGITATFEGSLYSNSACPASAGGAVGVNGGSAALTFNNGAGTYMVGGYNPGTLTINPTPVTGARPLADPLAFLVPPTDGFGLQAAYCPPTYGSRCNKQLKIGMGASKEPAILYPGIYPGGIYLGAQAVVVMTPGVYLMDGGGLNVQAGASLYSVQSGFDWGGGDPASYDFSNWATQDCPHDNSCGVLIYNYNWASVKDQIVVAAGASIKLRAYREQAAAANTVHGNATNEETWRNMLFWQARTPAPTSTTPQPPIELQGGGEVNLGGTVYAPGALSSMGGSSSGSGGGVELTIQFISWDLYLHGNVDFYFHYRAEDMVRLPDYGLIE